MAGVNGPSFRNYQAVPSALLRAAGLGPGVQAPVTGSKPPVTGTSQTSNNGQEQLQNLLAVLGDLIKLLSDLIAQSAHPNAPATATGGAEGGAPAAGGAEGGAPAGGAEGGAPTQAGGAEGGAPAQGAEGAQDAQSAQDPQAALLQAFMQVLLQIMSMLLGSLGQQQQQSANPSILAGDTFTPSAANPPVRL